MFRANLIHIWKYSYFLIFLVVEYICDYVFEIILAKIIHANYFKKLDNTDKYKENAKNQPPSFI